MIKKTLGILIISLVLMITTILGAQNITFKDVNGKEWFYNDLMYLAERDIINGTADGSFQAGALLSKDALIKTLVVAKGYNPGNADGYWAQNYINQADSLGWLTGSIPGQYTSPINRYETCLLIVNAIGSSEVYPSNLQDYAPYISDYNAIPAQYKNVVLKVFSLGIITGYLDSSFGGENTLTRAEMAAILSRFINPDNRKLSLNPSKLNTLKAFATDPDTKVFDNTMLKFEDNKILYNNPANASWIPITSSGLTPKIARISEDSYIDVADYISEKTTYSVLTSYNYNNFYMYVERDAVVRLTYSANDQENKITLSLPDLYMDKFMSLDSHVIQSLLAILKNVNRTEHENIYNYIIENFEYNTSVTPHTSTKTFDNINVKISAEQSGYYIILTIN